MRTTEEMVVAYFPQNDDDQEKKKASADNSEDDHPELDLSTYRSGPNHCHKRLHLQSQLVDCLMAPRSTLPLLG